MIKAGIVLCYLCNDIAFVAKRDIYSGERVDSEAVRHIDGSEIMNGSIVSCDSCGAGLDIYKLYNHNEVVE